MKRVLTTLSTFSISLMLLWLSAAAHAEIQIQHEQGILTLSKTPQKIVALEYSFVDTLAILGVSPIGIADDNDTERIISSVRSKIGNWTSVGMRSQPSLEVIAQLKPDLIIADDYRHHTIYAELSKIAPTLMLKSRGESYQDSLESAKTIAKVLNKSAQMNQRLAQHQKLMEQYKARFLHNHNGSIQFATVNDRGMWLHGPKSYTGSLIEFLGLSTAIPEYKQSHIAEVNLEMLLKTNPDWLFFSKSKPKTVLDSWEASPLYHLLTITKEKHAIEVSGQLWSLSRGILAAEAIASELDRYLNPKV